MRGEGFYALFPNAVEPFTNLVFTFVLSSSGKLAMVGERECGELLNFIYGSMKIWILAGKKLSESC